MKTNALTIKNLITLFGVTAMTIHTWKKGTPTKEALPESLTPAKVKRWATKHGVTMTCEPLSLLGTGIGKPGPKPKPQPEAPKKIGKRASTRRIISATAQPRRASPQVRVARMRATAC